MNIARMKLSKTSSVLIAGLLSLSALTVDSAQAQVLNGGFDDNLNDWEILGGVGLGPSDDNAFLFTEDESITTPQLPQDLEGFLGLTSNPLDDFFGGDYLINDGSALSQNISAVSGQSLSFDWNFLTNEDPLGPFDIRDGAYFSLVELDGLGNNISERVDLLADVDTATDISSSLFFVNETGFDTFSTGPLNTGTYRLGFVVFNDSDNLGGSGLLIDNVQLGVAPDPIPEPATILGSLFALSSASFSVHQKRKSQKKNKHN